LLLGQEFIFCVGEVETCRQQAPYALNPADADAVNPQATERIDTLHAFIQVQNRNVQNNTDTSSSRRTGDSLTNGVLLGLPINPTITNPQGNGVPAPVDGGTGNDE